MNERGWTSKQIVAGLILVGVRQNEIAKKLEMHPVSVNDVIYGRRKTHRIRAAIAEALGRPVEEIWPPAAKPE